MSAIMKAEANRSRAVERQQDPAVVRAIIKTPAKARAVAAIPPGVQFARDMFAVQARVRGETFDPGKMIAGPSQEKLYATGADILAVAKSLGLAAIPYMPLTAVESARSPFVITAEVQ